MVPPVSEPPVVRVVRPSIVMVPPITTTEIPASVSESVTVDTIVAERCVSTHLVEPFPLSIRKSLVFSSAPAVFESEIEMMLAVSIMEIDNKASNLAFISIIKS